MAILATALEAVQLCTLDFKYLAMFCAHAKLSWLCNWMQPGARLHNWVSGCPLLVITVQTPNDY